VELKKLNPVERFTCKYSSSTNWNDFSWPVLYGNNSDSDSAAFPSFKSVENIMIKWGIFIEASCPMVELLSLYRL